LPKTTATALAIKCIALIQKLPNGCLIALKLITLVNDFPVPFKSKCFELAENLESRPIDDTRCIDVFYAD